MDAQRRPLSLWPHMEPHLLKRWQQIVTVLGKHGLSWLIGRDRLRRTRDRRHPRDLVTQAGHLRAALGELGGAFIKLGQLISTRRDLLPADLADELSRLQDDAPALPLERVRAVIMAELGMAPEVAFAEFASTPLASASIAQVHAALLPDGRRVVVKVQRPEVADAIACDLDILTRLAAWMQTHAAVGRDYDLTGFVDEYAYMLRNELDFMREGRSMDKMRALLKDDPGLRVPQVFWEKTTARVLTMQRVDGVKVTDLDALDRAGIDRRVVAENATRLVMRMIFEFGFFHADPHPGNFFVAPGGVIQLIDFGVVGYVDARLRNSLLQAGIAVVQSDAEKLTDLLCDLCERDPVNRLALQRDLGRLLTVVSEGTVRALSSSAVIGQIFDIARRSKLQLPASLIALFRLILIGEGIGTQLVPDFQILAFAAPYFSQFRQRELAPAHLAGRVASAGLDTLDLGLGLPRQLRRLLSQVERGAISVRVDDEALRELRHHMQHMINRLALAILLSATIVSLGLAIVAFRPMLFEPYVDAFLLLGFPASLLIGGLLMWRMWRAR